MNWKKSEKDMQYMVNSDYLWGKDFHFLLRYNLK